MTITSRSSGIPRDLPNPLKPGLNSNETDLGIRSGPPSMNCDYSDPESSDRMGFESQGEPRSYSSRTLEVNSFPEGELQLYSPISPDYDLEVTPNTNWDWRTLSLTRIYWGHVENEEPQFSTLPRSTFKHGVIFPLPPDHLPSPGTPSRRTRGAKSSILVSENLATTVSPYFRFPASPIIVPPQFTEQCSSTGSPLRCLVSSYREIDPEKVNHSTRSYFYSFSPGIGEVLPTISSDHDGTVHNANNTEVEDERHDPMTCGCRRVLGKENIEDKNFEEALRLMSDDEDMSDIQKGCEELFLAGEVQRREYVFTDDKTFPLDLQEEPDDSDSDGLDSDSGDEGPSLPPSTIPLRQDVIPSIFDTQNGPKKRGRKRKAGPSVSSVTEEKPGKLSRGRPRKVLKGRESNTGVGVESGHLESVSVLDRDRRGREPPKGARDVRAIGL